MFLTALCGCGVSHKTARLAPYTMATCLLDVIAWRWVMPTLQSASSRVCIGSGAVQHVPSPADLPLQAWPIGSMCVKQICISFYLLLAGTQAVEPAMACTCILLARICLSHTANRRIAAEPLYVCIIPKHPDRHSAKLQIALLSSTGPSWQSMQTSHPTMVC